ncbi:MAG TPA: GntR family transcriptional regulator [Amycolatopsis sp.]|nr:GntR family transcriptional regulator [Amycolatopsis sp.]
MSSRGRAGEPRYGAIANQLQDRINSGEWLPGARMPTESALAAEFGVNRLTVGQALARLRRIGVVDVRQGSGTFVADPPPVLEIAVDPATQVIDEGSVHASIKRVSHNVVESVLGQEPDRPSATRPPRPRRGSSGRHVSRRLRRSVSGGAR